MSSPRLVWRLAAIAVVQTLAAVLLTVWAAARPLAGVDVPVLGGLLLVLTLAFAAAEHGSADLPQRDQIVTISLHELVAAVALVTASPVTFVLARTIGGLVYQLTRSNSPSKAAFNVTMFALDAAVTVSVFQLIVSGSGELTGPAAWVGSVVAIGMGQVLAIAAIAGAMSATGSAGVLRAAARTQQLMTPFVLATAAVGTLVAQLVLRDGRTLALGVTTGVLWFGVLRALELMGQRYGTLVAFHDHTARLQSATALAEAIEATSAAVHALTAATLAEVHLNGRAHPTASRRNAVQGYDAVTDLAPLADHTTAAPNDLSRRDVRRAVTEPLYASDGTVMGYLLAGWQRSVRRPAEAQQTLATVARQSEATIARLRLTASLHEELEDKHRRSLHDDLTKLPNRSHFTAQLDGLLARGDREAAVLLVELQGFRTINETLGHDAGDVVLRAASARMARTVRADDLVARFDGHRFAVLATGPDARDAGELADRIRDAVSRPYGHDGVRLEIQATVGISARVTGDPVDATTLVRRADTALNRARELGVGCELYRPGDDQETMRRLRHAAALRPAIADGTITAHFQPQLDALTGALVGVEALARWHDPALGSIPPSDFIPLAERTGAIRDLTHRVLEDSLAMVSRWRERGIPMRVALNVSPGLLTDIEFAAHVGRELQRHSVPAGALVLELTESAVIEDHASRDAMAAIRQLGVALSIDDYGTGYSSLQYLHRFAASELKIDRAFVAGLVDGSTSIIVQSTIDLAHGLGMIVVAEGVEDVATMERLAKMGCDVIQGWVSAPALDEQGLTAFVDQLVDGCWMPGVPA